MDGPIEFSSHFEVPAGAANAVGVTLTLLRESLPSFLRLLPGDG